MKGAVFLTLAIAACGAQAQQVNQEQSGEGSSHEAANASSTRPATEAELAAIREGLQRRLADADSAKFLDIKVNNSNFCGYLNAKNRLGAYVGFSPIYGMVMSDSTKKIVAAPMSFGEKDADITREMCAMNGLDLPPY